MRALRACLHAIDMTNKWVGENLAWVALVLSVLVTIDVLMRYVFDRPFVWDLDVNVQIAGIFAVLGGGYTLLYNGHVGVDVAVERLKTRGRAILDSVTLFITLVVMGGFFWSAVQFVADSVAENEHYSSFWAPVIWPFKIVVAIGILLLMLQAIAKFIRTLEVAVTGKKPEEGQP